MREDVIMRMSRGCVTRENVIYVDQEGVLPVASSCSRSSVNRSMACSTIRIKLEIFSIQRRVLLGLG